MLRLGERFLSDEGGATAIEYGLIAAFLGIGLIAAFVIFGNSLQGLFNFVSGRAGGAMNSAGV
jgi:pilus assembly protein Flp/PilA